MMLEAIRLLSSENVCKYSYNTAATVIHEAQLIWQSTSSSRNPMVRIWFVN